MLFRSYMNDPNTQPPESTRCTAARARSFLHHWSGARGVFEREDTALNMFAVRLGARLQGQGSKVLLATVSEQPFRRPPASGRQAAFASVLKAAYVPLHFGCGQRNKRFLVGSGRVFWHNCRYPFSAIDGRSEETLLGMGSAHPQTL